MTREFSRTNVAVGLLALIWCLSVPAWAQITTGGITGQVSDQTGGVLPGVVVAITNEATQDRRQAITNDRGEFIFTALSRGQYSLRAELSGFSPVVVTLEVRVNETIRQDFQLIPSALAEAVTVTGVAPLLQATKGEVADVMDHRAIVELPLNGRNFVQLVALEPGAVSTAKLPGGGTSYLQDITGGNYSVHGAPADGTSYLFDGMSLRDVVDTRVAFRPTVDAIQEFRYQAANYSAGFGQASGGVVNIASRSGTNQFHGSAWEFFRDDALDARNYFATEKPPFRQHQFGGAAGGPIVPNKMFVFGSYEGGRSDKGITRVITVPTDAQRAGDFRANAPIFNPFDIDPITSQRRPFPNNQIPASMFSPQAVASLERLMPRPNQPGASGNLIATATQSVDSDQMNVRVDYQLSPSDAIFARYSTARFDRLFPFTFASLPNFVSVWDTPAKNAVASYTRILGSNTVNELKFGFTRSVQILEDFEQNVPVNRELGIGGLSGTLLGNPNLSIAGFAQTGVIGNAPNNRTDDTVAVWDNISHVRGSHSLSTGFNLSWYRQDGGANPNAHGNFGFDGSFTAQRTATGVVAGTGNAMADFLLGLPRTSARCCVSSDGFKDFRKIDIGVYIQDDWKVTPSFTLNFGVRYEVFQPASEQLDRYAQPDYTRAPASTLRVASVDGVSRTLMNGLDLNNIAPRVNFAYVLNARTVVRGGYGVFYNSTNLITTFAMASNPPFTDRESFVSDVRTPQLTLANAFPSALGIPSLTFSSVDPGYVDPYNQNWNIGIQRELGFSTSTAVTYIGNKGSKLKLSVEQNSPTPGNGPIGPRRPIPGFSGDSRNTNLGESIYHGLEVKLQRRIADGLGFLASYVWSKCIDNGGVSISYDGAQSVGRDPRNPSMWRGVCSYDVPHRGSGNFIYELPFGRGGTGIGSKLVSDWQVQGIVTLEQGQPFSVRLTGDNTNTGQVAHPDLVPGQDPNKGPKTPQQWFNVNAFTRPEALSWGNAGRNIVRGPGFASVDMAVQRVVRLPRDDRLELRLEAFNVLNRVNFLQPGVLFGTPGFAVVSGAFDPRDVQLSVKYSF